MSQIRVLLVDTNDHLLAGVSEWLTEEPGVRIAGVARSGNEAVEMVARLRPDLVLIDARLPDTSGFQATQHIKALPDAPAVVLMTLHDSSAARERAASAGADGFIADAAIADQLRPLVRSLRELVEGSADTHDGAARGTLREPSKETPAEPPADR